MGKKKRNSNEDEPLPEGEDWVEWGGELIMAMGFTAGGAPYGVSLDEFREDNEMQSRDIGWARAKRALFHALEGRSDAPAEIEIGWVKKIGEGLYRDVFMADVGPFDGGPRLVALIPRHDAPADLGERVKREPALLEWLATLDLPIITPRWATVVFESEIPVLVREFLPGAPLDLRAGRQTRMRPWQVVAEVASSIHGINFSDIPDIQDLIPGYKTRRAHAIASVEEIAEIQGDPLTNDVFAWINNHLPPEEPARLLHGDLLGQNILIDFFEPSQPVSVIDWEYSTIGDPAYDLAIVTRGSRRPFQLADGLDRVLGAYSEAGGAPITRADVHIYELCLVGGYLRDSLRGDHHVRPPEIRKQLRNLLTRAEKSVQKDC